MMYNKKNKFIWATIDFECVQRRIRQINELIEPVLPKTEVELNKTEDNSDCSRKNMNS